MTAAEVVIVEDDAELRALLVRGLAQEGFASRGVGSGSALLEYVSRRVPDALIVDVGLPDADGRELCQALRAQGIQAPVLFLTARDALADRLAGFGSGGDDYMVKPFDFDELVARLRALMRRAGTDQGIVVGSLRLDPASHAAVCDGRSVTLTPTEFRLLGALASKPQEAVRRRELIVAGWGAGAIVHDNTLDVYMARLRRKLRDLPAAGTIDTIHGVGYSFG
jgi:two-component system OmpR family response regulator